MTPPKLTPQQAAREMKGTNWDHVEARLWLKPNTLESMTTVQWEFRQRHQ